MEQQTTTGEQKFNLLQIANRKCECCNEIMAIEWRGMPDQPEEIFYFCINKEKNCPMYRLTQ